jgi:hypothetical protein
MICGYEIMNFLLVSVIVYNDYRLPLSTCTTPILCVRNFHIFTFYVCNLLSD